MQLAIAYKGIKLCFFGIDKYQWPGQIFGNFKIFNFF